ncbi:hypothetical protein [Albirhodobacter sp. R86504]|uniref:hypothetical protein n=1 Tax=Albirhodobacter sp. R86504 TaxID=3093848 RepID=UPI00367087C3
MAARLPRTAGIGSKASTIRFQVAQCPHVLWWPAHLRAETAYTLRLEWFDPRQAYDD